MSIRAKDLRIGNRVMLKDKNVYYVTGITNNQVALINPLGSSDVKKVAYANVSCVPITGGLLGVLGFKKERPGLYVYGKNSIKLCYLPEKDIWIHYLRPSVIFRGLHDIENYFRCVTGNDVKATHRDIVIGMNKPEEDF